MSEPAISDITYDSLAEIVKIERESFPSPWSIAMFVLEISKPSSICLVGSINDEVCGYLICSRYDTVWHLMNVAVATDKRRQGIAQLLLDELFKRVKDPNARFTLEVRNSNSAAVSLYQRFGFSSVGKRRRYYQDNGEDALIMWRTPGTLKGTLDDVPAV